MTDRQDKQAWYIMVFVFVVAIILLAWYLMKKGVNVFSTESPVMDETSKKILNDDELTRKYYDAIEKEKSGQQATITVEGEEYIVKRAGKHSHSVAAA